MELKFVIVIICLSLASTFAQEGEENNLEEESVNVEQEPVDNEASATNILNTLAALQPPRTSNSDLNYLASYPYEGAHENVYGTFAAPQPTLGVSINTRALLGPQVEVLHLIEDFFNLSSDLIRRLYSLYSENQELIRVVFNVAVKKLTGFQGFIVKGISIVRKFLEFALNIFSNFSITLPSITLGSNEVEYAPHATYGVPPSETNSTNFQ